jgi:hypothetical protein
MSDESSDREKYIDGTAIEKLEELLWVMKRN